MIRSKLTSYDRKSKGSVFKHESLFRAPKQAEAGRQSATKVGYA